MSLNVLIVDDSRATRRFLGRVLDMCGIGVSDCLQAADGEEALGVLRQSPVDLVLTDINMPRMNGEQFLRVVKNTPELSGIPVVIVSTDATDNRKARVLALGAKGYVTKPVTPEALRNELERVLAEEPGGLRTDTPLAMVCPVRVADGRVEPLLHSVVAHVFETMCFQVIDGTCQDKDAHNEELVAVRLRFGGDAVGTLALGISEEAAQRMAADFFGADDPADVQPDQVESFAGEIANVICGSVLGWCKSDGHFELSTPEACPEVFVSLEGNATCQATYPIEGGWIRVALQLGLVDVEAFAVQHC